MPRPLALSRDVNKRYTKVLLGRKTSGGPAGTSDAATLYRPVGDWTVPPSPVPSSIYSNGGVTARVRAEAIYKHDGNTAVVKTCSRPVCALQNRACLGLESTLYCSTPAGRRKSLTCRAHMTRPGPGAAAAVPSLTRRSPTRGASARPPRPQVLNPERRRCPPLAFRGRARDGDVRAGRAGDVRRRDVVSARRCATRHGRRHAAAWRRRGARRRGVRCIS
jgi:hypothetical protein